MVAVAPRLVEMDGGVAGGGIRCGSRRPGREDQFTFQLRRLPTLASDARELLLIDHLSPEQRRRGAASRYADAESRRAVRRSSRRRRRRSPCARTPSSRSAASTSASCRRGTKTSTSASAWRREGRSSTARRRASGTAAASPRRASATSASFRSSTATRCATAATATASRRALAYRVAARRRDAPAPRCCSRFAPTCRGPGAEAARAYLAVLRLGARPRRSRMTPTSRSSSSRKDDAADLPLSLGSAVAQRGVACETLARRQRLDRRLARGRRRAFGGAVRLLALPENVGFAAAMNAGIEATRGPLRARAESRLPPRAGLRGDPRARGSTPRTPRTSGSASGRLLRARGRGARADARARLGRASSSRRRAGTSTAAAGEPRRRPVSSARRRSRATSGAAGFYRRAALESARISTGYFDSDFFLYREDADLAWRLPKLGWRCLYVPAAVACHRRRNLPERRRRMSALANMHSVKNRFLLRINNQTAAECARDARADARARPRRPRRLPDGRAHLAAGVRLAVEEPEAALGEAAGDPGEGASERDAPPLTPTAGEGPLAAVGLEFPLRPSGRVAVRAATAIASRRCASASSAPAAFPRATAASRRSPRSSRRAWPRAATTSRSTRARATRSRASRRTAARRSACCRRFRRSTSTRSCTALLSGVDAALRALRRRPRLQRDQRRVVVSAAPRGPDARRPERGRPRAPPAQVERARAARLPHLGDALDDRSRRRRLGRARDPGLLPRRATASPRSSSRTAATCRSRRAARRSTASARRPSATCSTSRASSPRTTPTRSSARTATCRATTPLVVVGDAPYAADYIARLRAEADPRVLFPGAIYGEGYRRAARPRGRLRPGDGGRRHAPGARRGAGLRARRLLQRDARERGGRRGARPCRSTSDDPASLARLLQGILDDPAAHSVWKETSQRTRTRERYRWDDVVDRYEAVLEGRRVIP